MGVRSKTLGELVTIKTGKLNANAAVEGGKYPFFTCSKEIFAIDDFAFDCEAILLAGNNAVGDFNVKHYKGKFNAYQRTYVITINDENEILYPFLYLQIQLALKRFKEQSVGAGTKFLKIGMINELPISVLNLEEQKRIVAILNQAFADIEQARAKTEQNLKNARELFESYLQQVFSQRKEGWEERKWGDVCQFVRGPFGGSLKKSMFKEEGFAIYEQKHAIHDHIEQIRYFIDDQKFEEMRRFEVKPGELIMSCSGVTLGRVSVIPEGAPEGIINQALLKLAPNEDINIHFLKYWVRSKIFQDIIFEHSGGAAIPNVPAAKILKEITLLIPSLERQSATVNEIDSVLAETNKVSNIYKRKIESLDELKKSILQKAFSGELTKEKEGAVA